MLDHSYSPSRQCSVIEAALDCGSSLAITRCRNKIFKQGISYCWPKQWAEQEDLACRLFYPHFYDLERLLWWRTPGAIRWRCKKLGLLKAWGEHRWTAREISILRRLYPSATREEICAAIPGVEWRKICVAARYYGFRRNKRPYKITGVIPLDQVRAHCYVIKWTMRDLDEEARTRRYFQTRGYRTTYPNFRAINRAAEILGGHMEVVWEQQPDT